MTRRQQDVAELVAQGLTNREIAERLFISEKAVKNHLHALYGLYDPEDGGGHQYRVRVALDWTRQYGE